MKKRTYLLGLCSALIFSVGVFNTSMKTDASEATVYDGLKLLLNEYYDGGVYKKDTKIHVDPVKIGGELTSLFHAQVTSLERTTYYGNNELWMSRGVEGEGVTYSYYGTKYQKDNDLDGVTNGTAEKPYVAPTNASTIDAKEKSMEEFYVTLYDFLVGTHKSVHSDYETLDLATGWEVSEGVYSTNNPDVIDGFRLFTAPLWLGKNKENGNYIDYTKATIQEVGSNLVMKLWTSIGDEGKLIDGVETDGDNLLFSEATISNVNTYGENLQKYSKNLQEGLGTDFEGYSPENPDHAKLFDPDASVSAGSEGTWYADANGINAYAHQSGYKIRLVEEDGNTALKVGGFTHKELFRVGINLTEEVCEPGTYVAKIKIKRGPEATIPKFFFKINKGSRTDSNVPLQYIKDGPSSVTGFFFNNTGSTDPNLNFEFDTEWKEYTTTFTIEEGSAVDNATDVCAAFVMYTSNKSANKAKDYMLIDDFQLYRVNDLGTDFEGYDKETQPTLFPEQGTLVADKWHADLNENEAFGVQDGYKGCKLYEDGENNALMVYGTKEVIRAGIDVSDEIKESGIYRISLKVKLGPNADKIGNILFRFNDKSALASSSSVVKAGYRFYEPAYGITLSKDEWTTLDVTVVVSEGISFKTDLCMMLMVYTYGNETSSKDAELHKGNYVLVDDVEIYQCRY